jgi:hypothetical protein
MSKPSVSRTHSRNEVCYAMFVRLDGTSRLNYEPLPTQLRGRECVWGKGGSAYDEGNRSGEGAAETRAPGSGPRRDAASRARSWPPSAVAPLSARLENNAHSTPPHTAATSDALGHAPGERLGENFRVARLGFREELELLAPVVANHSARGVLERALRPVRALHVAADLNLDEVQRGARVRLEEEVEDLRARLGRLVKEEARRRPGGESAVPVLRVERALAVEREIDERLRHRRRRERECERGGERRAHFWLARAERESVEGGARRIQRGLASAARTIQKSQRCFCPRTRWDARGPHCMREAACPRAS